MEYFDKNTINLTSLRVDIEKLRAQGLHQSLAKMLGVSDSTFARKLNGSRRLTLQELSILAQLLKKNINDYLQKGDNNES